MPLQLAELGPAGLDLVLLWLSAFLLAVPSLGFSNITHKKIYPQVTTFDISRTTNLSLETPTKEIRGDQSAIMVRKITRGVCILDGS